MLNKLTTFRASNGRTCPILRSRTFFDKVGRDWNRAWVEGVTPWETKAASPPLVSYIQRLDTTKLGPHPQALVPGCGSGFDCIYLSKYGFDVVGLDMSESAINVAKSNLLSLPIDSHSKVEYVVDDFFLYDNRKFDFIFDYLFFAAIDPPARLEWAKSVSRLLRNEESILMTLVFPLNIKNQDSSIGPPYPVLLSDYEQVLNSVGLVCVEQYMVSRYQVS